MKMHCQKCIRNIEVDYSCYTHMPLIIMLYKRILKLDTSIILKDFDKSTIKKVYELYEIYEVTLNNIADLIENAFKILCLMFFLNNKKCFKN